MILQKYTRQQTILIGGTLIDGFRKSEGADWQTTWKFHLDPPLVEGRTKMFCFAKKLPFLTPFEQTLSICIRTPRSKCFH